MQNIPDKVLIIEDEENIRSGMVELLKGKYTVYEAGTGAEAVEKAEELFPYLDAGIVLLDIRLPDMSGIEVLKKIKDQAPMASIIMVTALNDTKLAVEALAEGASDYITKPFTGDDLLVRIARVSDNAELIRQMLWMYQKLDRWRVDIDSRLLEAKNTKKEMNREGKTVSYDLFRKIVRPGERGGYNADSYGEIEKAINEKLGKKIQIPEKKAKFLVVDDEADTRDGIVELIKSRFEVKSAGSGGEALAVFKADNFDFVLLDIRLPDMNGIDVLKEMVKANENAYVIMVTALKDISITVDAMKSGAKDYITKPFTSDELFGVIDNQIKLKLNREKIELYRKEIDKELFQN